MESHEFLERKKIIGLTGGIGSGKSTVRRVFETLGVPAYDADSRAKWLMVNDLKLVSELRDLLGAETFFPNGTLNKKFVAERIFNEKSLLAGVNALVHPAVARDFASWVAEQTADYLIKEAAILFESGSYKDADAVVLVTAPDDVRIARVCARDLVAPEAVRARMANQMSEDEKKRRSQFIISNDGTLALLPQILEIHQKLQLLEPKSKK